jgi:hypothetical protein
MPRKKKRLTITEDDIARFDSNASLDEVVHDMKSKEASCINNAGVSAQLEYLRECGMTDTQIIEAAGV